MSENRPNPITLADTIRGLIDCWLELDREMTRSDPSAKRSSTESAVPLNLDVLDAKRAIDTFASTYVHMLIDETDWTPEALNTPALLRGILKRIGHFTHNDDALVAYEFAEDVDRLSRESWAIARPDGKARIPIGPCYEDECDGKLRVLIDRDRPMDPESLRLWQPTAVCDEDGEHRILARLYASDTLARERMTPV